MQTNFPLPLGDEAQPLPTLSLAEILSSLSYALDLTSGQMPGHTVRTCLIGMRLAASLRLDEAAMNSLYHALLMKDSGCSGNPTRMFEIYDGDGIRTNYDSKVMDRSNIVEAIKYTGPHTRPRPGLRTRARRMLKIAGMDGITDHLMEWRCSRGADIALSLGLGEAAAECIRFLDEHWDGQGAPYHLRGDQIPILARIACLVQTMEVFSTTFGLEPAYEMLRARAGRWFDPELVCVAGSFHQDDAFWYSVRESPHTTLLGLDIEAAAQPATEERLDSVCDAFAQIVDAKSHFTGEHSSRVCEVTMEIADGLGITGPRRTTLRRAALLHDIGKLAVPNTILNKNGRPTDQEWDCIRRHPFYTEQILGQITGFERLTEIATAHHERLDGRGYFRGLGAEDLDLDMRALAVADVFDALSTKRPYRGALPPDEVFAILDRDALDPDCVAVLKSACNSQSHTAPYPGLARAA